MDEDDIYAQHHDQMILDDQRNELAEKDALIAELLAAAKLALYEMCRTVAPRNAFTDAVDALDAAISKAEQTDGR